MTTGPLPIAGLLSDPDNNSFSDVHCLNALINQTNTAIREAKSQGWTSLIRTNTRILAYLMRLKQAQEKEQSQTTPHPKHLYNIVPDKEFPA